VAALIEQFRQHYKLNYREAEVSITTYLRQLAKRRLIGIAVPEDAAKRRKKR
jgi:hypothetical protein